MRKVSGGIRRAAPRGVPRHHGEFVGEALDLGLERSAAIADVAVDQDHQRALTCSLVRDAKSADLDLHRRMYS
jgi:hypothetical protein